MITIKNLKERKIRRKLLKSFKALKIRIYGINRLSVETWNIIYKTLIKLFDMYPFMRNGNVCWIRVKSNRYFRKYMVYNKTVDAMSGFYYKDKANLYVNTDLGIGITLNMDQINSLNETETILSFKVSKYTMISHIIAHEFGHLIDLTLTGYAKKEWRGIVRSELLENRFKHQCSDDIVEKALNVYFSRKEHLIFPIIEEVGKDSVSDSHEIFAECIALNFSNIEGILSNIVINELHNFIEKNYSNND